MKIFKYEEYTIAQDSKRDFTIVEKNNNFFKLDNATFDSLFGKEKLEFVKNDKDNILYMMGMIFMILLTLYLYFRTTTYSIIDVNFLPATLVLIINIFIHELGHVLFLKKFYKENVYYMLTTNGLLLNDANIKFLAENEIGLAISIDGPQKEHDRLRVKIDGSGSFEQIANNIKKLSEAYPYYFRTRVNAVCVFDPKTDIEKVEEFYEELEKTYNIPRAIFVNKVSDNETNYYDQFSDTDNQKYDDRIKNLMRKFHEKKVADKEISSYLSAIAGGGPMSVIVRRRIDEIQGHCIKSSGACIPGQKICVNSSGIFDICERVNGHNSIGNVEQGIDGKAVLKIMKEYNEVALEDCSNCPIKKLCGYCYLNFETENGFKKNKAGCAFHRNVVKTNLSRYVSIYEENPNCRYFLDTDTAELENN